ncbi:MAG: DUF5678 domain-containing protein, partial [bacterium]|nr:DUF5678 domain-containing protein [bacterium]
MVKLRVMKAIDMTHIYSDKRYKGKWVALKSHEEREVVAYDRTLKGVLIKSAKMGTPHPAVMQVPEEIL